MTWYLIYIFIALIATLLSICFTPICILLAKKFNFYDKPLEQRHKTHTKNTPLLGGVAIFSAWSVSIFIGFILIKSAYFAKWLNCIKGEISGIFNVSDNIFFIALAALLAILLGLADDKFNMSAKIKLLGQILIAVIAVQYGDVKITIFVTNIIFTWFISIFWILFIMNAINFFDNMDGLAIGVGTIAIALFTVVAAINQQYFVASLGAVTFGSTLGFWFFNHSPASIFMGDAGSHFLGFIIAVISASVTYINSDSISYIPILIPVFILGIPVFDTIAVIFIRLYNRKPIYIGDNNHISHRFQAMGMSRKNAVAFVHLLTLIIGLGVLPLIWGDVKTTLILVFQSLAILLLIDRLQHIMKNKKLTDLENNK